MEETDMDEWQRIEQTRNDAVALHDTGGPPPSTGNLGYTTKDCMFSQRSEGKRGGESGVRRGDFVVLVLDYGIIFDEVKSVGGVSSRQRDRQQDESVVVAVLNAMKQLNQKESAVKLVLPHWSPHENQASVEMENVVKKSADQQELFPKSVFVSALQTILKAENSFARYFLLSMLLADVESKDAQLSPLTHPLSWHAASSLLIFLWGKYDDVGIKSHGSQRKPETDGSILNNTDHRTAKPLALITDLLEAQEQSFDDHQIKAWKHICILFADRQETEMGLLPTNKCREEPDSTEIIPEKCIEDESGEDVIDLNQLHTDAAPEETPEQDQCSSENSTAEDEHDKSFTCGFVCCTNPDLHTQCTEDVLDHDYNDTDKAETTDGTHTTDGMNVKLDFCWSNGIYCQETNRIWADGILATEDNTRHDTAKQMIAQEEETYLVEKNASHGSAGTAVSQDSNHSDRLTTSVPAAQQVSDQADPSGDGNDNKHSSPNQDTTKAVSTIPVPNLAEEEEKEETTVLIKYEIEEKQISQKKNKKEDQGKLRTDGDGEIGRVLGEYYSVQNIEPQLRQQFVFMMRAETRLVHNGVENEMRRLATFHNFCPPEGVYIIPLANAGFFLPANNSVSSADQRSVLQTLLECAFCGVAVAVMKFMGRRPMDVHKEVSPGCPFVLGRENRNVSVAQMAQTSGAQFLDTVTVTSDGVSSPHGEGETPGGQAVLATDGDSATVPTAAVLALPGPGKGNAAEKPAFPLTDTVSVPPQSVTVGHAAVHASGHGRPKPGPQQLPQAGNRLGDAVSDARGIASSLPPSTLQTPPQPRQTATVTQAPSATQTAARAQESSAGPENGEGSRNSTQPSSSPTADTENSAQAGNGQGEGTQERQVVTYEQLGIFAQRPKRQDMAVAATRINTFEAWPHADSHPASEMAEAGFYYTGHADLVRCFYCKGGLKTWERSDRPWVEHSRWFPRCPFVRLCKGQKFVDAIQKLNEAGGRPTITEDDVKREMQRQEDEERRNRPTTLLPTPPTVREIQTDSAEGAVGGSAALRADFAVGDGNDTQEIARRLEEENQEMKETTLCKMCQTREVNVLFLPCGHLVACAYCAPALRTCAMCRQPVKGTVRVQLDEEESVDV